ncbi:MAG: saccharopine dehydrogenase C-terminal domain-containing protein [bacterium]|nr:saccharopine dehydrogenase C-terminal domain-containing protein [bacterium]
MKKAIILGAGRQGLTAGEFLREKNTEVSFIDVNNDNLKEAAKAGFKSTKKSLSCFEDVAKAVKNFDLAISALPARLGRMAQLGAIASGVNMVDVSYSEDDPLKLHSLAKKHKVTIIPDAGIAPGTSNLMAGRLYKSFDKAETIKIYVGGMPEKNLPPLGYSITWSPEDLVSEYERKAKIQRNFKRLTVEPLTGVEKIEFKGFEPLDAFYTDGLRTLSKTLKSVKNLEEKTMRYKGHIEKIKFLFEMGYFEDKAGDTCPRKTSLELLKRIKYKNVRDVLLMRVIGEGTKGGKKKRIEYEIIDFADKKHSAMERTTGYSLGAFSYWLLKNPQRSGGILTPEEIGMNEESFESIISLLAEKRIKTVVREAR